MNLQPSAISVVFSIVCTIAAMAADQPATKSPPPKSDDNFITTIGTFERFDGTLTLKVYQQDGKLNYWVCRNVPPEKSESGPAKAAIDPNSKWFIYAETFDEVLIFDGNDSLLIRPFHDRRPKLAKGGFYELCNGSPPYEKLPKAVLDRLPKKLQPK